MVVTFLLGFVAAWRGDFGPKDAAILNRMVHTYAVPPMLFAGTISTPRAELSQNLPLLMALCVAMVGLYVVSAGFRIGSSIFSNLNSRVPRFMLPFLTTCSVRRLRPLESFTVAASLLMFQ